MISQEQIDVLRQSEWVDWITALKSGGIHKLVAGGDLQLSLFDECKLAEIQAKEFPGELLIVCRNPALALKRVYKHTSMLEATSCEPGKVQAMVENPRGRRRRISNKYKMAKHFLLRVGDGVFSFARKDEKIAEEAALDGLYVLRTTCTREELGTRTVVRAYKQLKVGEHAFRQMKSSELLIRPIYHHPETRVRAHVFLCMFAYYVAFELKERPAPLLFTDDTPMAPAERSPRGKAKAGSKLCADGFCASEGAQPRRPSGSLPTGTAMSHASVHRGV